jgi:hypothetical protein
MRTRDSRAELTMLIGTWVFSTMMLAWAAASHMRLPRHRLEGGLYKLAEATS